MEKDSNFNEEAYLLKLADMTDDEIDQEIMLLTSECMIMSDIANKRREALHKYIQLVKLLND